MFRRYQVDMEMTGFQVVAGIIFLLLGGTFIVYRRKFVDIAHSLLNRMYGEVFADITVNRKSGPALTCTVGFLFIALGAYFILDVFLS